MTFAGDMAAIGSMQPAAPFQLAHSSSFTNAMIRRLINLAGIREVDRQRLIETVLQVPSLDKVEDE